MCLSTKLGKIQILIHVSDNILYMPQMHEVLTLQDMALHDYAKTVDFDVIFHEEDIEARIYNNTFWRSFIPGMSMWVFSLLIFNTNYNYRLRRYRVNPFEQHYSPGPNDYALTTWQQSPAVPSECLSQPALSGMLIASDLTTILFLMFYIFSGSGEMGYYRRGR